MGNGMCDLLNDIISSDLDWPPTSVVTKCKYKYKYRAEQAQVPDAKDLDLRGLFSNPVLYISITVSVLSF